MPVIPYIELENFLRRLFEGQGATIDCAASTAESLIQSEASGYTTHGLSLVPAYLEAMVRTGCMKSSPEVLSEKSSYILLNGQQALGPHVLAVAAEKAILRSKDIKKSNGFCIVAVKNPGHVGRLAYGINMGLDQGCIMFASVATAFSSIAAVVATPGGVKRIFGTNPLAIGIPIANHDHFLLDFSTAASSFYAIKEALKLGRPVAEGVLVDDSGAPTTEPSAFFKGGAIQPTAGYKGFGLSVATVLLAAMFTADTYEFFDSQQGIDGLLIAAIYPSAWISTDKSDFLLNSLIDALKSEIDENGPDSIYIPGSRASRNYHSALKEGVLITELTYQELRSAALRLHVDPLPL